MAGTPEETTQNERRDDDQKRKVDGARHHGKIRYDDPGGLGWNGRGCAVAVTMIDRHPFISTARERERRRRSKSSAFPLLRYTPCMPVDDLLRGHLFLLILFKEGRDNYKTNEEGSIKSNTRLDEMAHDGAPGETTRDEMLIGGRKEEERKRRARHNGKIR